MSTWEHKATFRENLDQAVNNGNLKVVDEISIRSLQDISRIFQSPRKAPPDAALG